MDQDIKTIIQYPADSVEYDIPFDYLSRKFIRVSLLTDSERLVLANITDYRYVSKTRIKLLVSTAGYTKVEIQRFTSASERIVDFSDGSVLRASDLNVAQIQSAHIAEEARDVAFLSISPNVAGQLDARGRRILNVGDPVEDGDAVNLETLHSTLAVAINKTLRHQHADIAPLQGILPNSILGFDAGGNPYTFTAQSGSAQELAQHLQSTAGASSVGALDGGTIQDALLNIVNVRSFRRYNTSPNDWGPALRKAVEYAASIGISDVWVTEHITVSSYGDDEWVLPFDDGTVSPDRIADGSEVNLPSEPMIPMRVFCDLPYGMNIRGYDRQSCSITFNWDGTTVDVNQGIAFVGRVRNWDGSYAAGVGKINRLASRTTCNQFSGISVKGAMIGYVSDGVAQWLYWDDVAFHNCLFGLLSAGMDHCEFGYIHFKDTVAGLLTGGWWQTRNAGNYPQAKLPPYPAADVQAAGWNDFIYINSLMDDGAKDTWTEGSLYDKADEFFDTYFYKTRHSVKVEDGGTGRMTKKTNAGGDAYSEIESDPFRGVASRSFYFMSRNMHSNKNIFVNHIKVHGRHRIPICGTQFQTGAWAGEVTSCYIERSPFTNTNLTSGSGNDFYSNPLNKYNVTWPYGNRDRIKLYTSTPATVVQGKLGVRLMHPSNSIQASASSDGVLVGVSPMRQTVFSTNLTNITPTSLFQVGIQTPTSYTTVAAFFRLMAFMPPISFNSTSYEGRDVSEVLFTSVAYRNSKTPITEVANGATDGSERVAIGGNSFLSYIRTRNQVEAKYFLQLPPAVAGFTSALYIPMDGLPVPLTTVASGVLGNTVPEVVMSRASYGDPTKPWRTASFTLGSDGKYYLSLNSDFYGSTKGALAELAAGSYLVFTLRYTAA